MIFPLLLSFETSFATPEPILITKSPSMENVIFDGKWTNFSEWKQSSHNMYTYDNGNFVVHLRTAHFEDFIYVFVDSISDTTPNEKSDEAMICFDGKNNKESMFDNNDFCFSVSFDSTHGKTFQGMINDDSASMMQKIPNPESFIAISTLSDENDRYTTIPHTSYEFRIPIELLERSDNYGFYLSVYDADIDKFFTWPKDSLRNDSEDFPLPSTWGNLVSPDKSLPEFNLPILILVILILTTILIQSKAKFGLSRS